MRALILVAGQSVRMGYLTKSSHKTLLKVADKPILNWMLRALQTNNVRDIIFVSGYHQDQLKQYVASTFADLSVTWVENVDYDTTNTAYSVNLARESVLGSGDDIVLINGDVVLDHRAIQAVLAEPKGNILATRLDRCGAEEVKFRLDKDRRIVEIGKHLSPADAAGESVGINRLSKDHLPALFDMIQQRIDHGEGRKEYYEHAFNALIGEGMEFRPADVTDLPVMEVDTPEDYDTVCAQIASRLVVA